MKIRIEQVMGLMVRGLIKRGLSENDSDLVAKNLLEAELMGKKTHGIGKIFLLDDAIAKRVAAPEIVKDKATTRTPDMATANALMGAAMQAGLRTRVVGNALAFSPPLTITAEEVESIVQTMGDVLVKWNSK